MSVFIKRYKAKSGIAIIQVVHKDGRKVARTVHIGNGHSSDDVDLPIALANEEIRGAQTALELLSCEASLIALEVIGACSGLLWESTPKDYDWLGFSLLDDDVFRQLVCARIIEPAGKVRRL
jgi:hypothetical protein